MDQKCAFVVGVVVGVVVMMYLNQKHPMGAAAAQVPKKVSDIKSGIVCNNAKDTVVTLHLNTINGLIAPKNIHVSKIYVTGYEDGGKQRSIPLKDMYVTKHHSQSKDDVKATFGLNVNIKGPFTLSYVANADVSAFLRVDRMQGSWSEKPKKCSMATIYSNAGMVFRGTKPLKAAQKSVTYEL